MPLQLDPMVPMSTDDGRKCTAFVAVDYGQEHHLLFTCFMDESREIWTFPSTRLRARDNVTMSRPAVAPGAQEPRHVNR